jgi:hypothetical protein
MKLKIVSLLLLTAHLTACDVNVEGTSAKDGSNQKTSVVASDLLSVGLADAYVDNTLEITAAMPNGGEHTWTWKAPAKGQLLITAPSYVTIGCSASPFDMKLRLASELSPASDQQLPADLAVEKDVTYSFTAKIYPHSCMGANYSIGVKFTAEQKSWRHVGSGFLTKTL